MPLDATPPEPTVQARRKARVKPDLSTPSLEALVYILRHRDHWPESFEWDFAVWKSCAVGLAFSVFGEEGTPVNMPELRSHPLAHARIFADPTTYRRKRHADVSPNMVAGQIEKFLADPKGYIDAIR
jgi:hypothetical protein